MITRREFARRLMAGVSAFAAVPFAACDGATMTLAEITSAIQTACSFVVKWEELVPVVISVLTTFNAAAGAGATVAAALGKQITDMICKAVMASPAFAQMQAQIRAAAPGPAVPLTIEIVVNGVTVTGRLIAKTGG